MTKKRANQAKPPSEQPKSARDRGVELDDDVPPERLAGAEIEGFIPDPDQTHRRVPDDFAEYLGEKFVQAATSGNDVDADEQDIVLPEELGGPFIETDAETEFGATMTQGAQFEDEPTLPEAFPTAVRADTEQSLGLEEPNELALDEDEDLLAEGEQQSGSEPPLPIMPPPPNRRGGRGTPGTPRELHKRS